MRGVLVCFHQIWAWSRISFLTPRMSGPSIGQRRMNIDEINGDDGPLPIAPYGAEWLQYHNFADSLSNNLRTIRESLDRQTPEEV